MRDLSKGGEIFIWENARDERRWPDKKGEYFNVDRSNLNFGNAHNLNFPIPCDERY